MRPTALIGKTTSLAVLVGAAAVLMFLMEARNPGVRRPSAPSELDGREDRQGRASFELMRLRDPATGVIPEGIRKKELAFARRIPSRESIQPLAKGEGAWQDLAWSARGPLNIGGRTRALAIDASNTAVLLAGAVSGGMWRSVNGGTSWAKTTAPDQLHNVTCIVQDTRSGRTHIWYCGTGENVGNSASGGGGASCRGDGMFKSTNGGLTWEPLPSTVRGTPQQLDSPFDYVWNLAIDPSSAQDELYAATVSGIQRSVDGGGTWTTVLGEFSNNSSRFTDVAVSSSGVVYATMSEAAVSGGTSATQRGVWRSVDGVNWTRITPSAPAWPSVYRRVVIGIAPSNESRVYFLGDTPGSGLQTTYGDTQEWHSFWAYRYLSGNGSAAGGSWEDRSAHLPAYGGQIGDFASQASYDMLVEVKPDDENVVLLGGTNLYRSLNGLADRTTLAWIGGYATKNDISQYPGHHCDQHALVFVPGNPKRAYSGHDGGVSTTADITAPTVAWTSLNNGYNTTQFYTVAINRLTPGDYTIIGGTQDNGTVMTFSSSASVPWLAVLSGDGGFCAIEPGRTFYIASFQYGRAYRLNLDENGGLRSFARIDPAGGTGYMFINPFAVDPSNTAVVYFAAGAQLWRNSNIASIPTGVDAPATSNWTNLANCAIPGGTISAISVTVANPSDRVYYGSADGRVFRLDGAAAATPQSNPLNISSGKGLPVSAYVSCIAVDPTNGNHTLLVFSNYGVQSLFSTIDAGATWNPVSGNLEQQPDGQGTGPSVRWATIQTKGENPTYFVGTSTGLYSTQTLNGQSTQWAQEGASVIGNVVVDMIESRTSDGLVVAATHGQGIFSGIIGSTGPPPPVEPTTPSLYQNYPNPFNGSTAIRVFLPVPERVLLKVFTLDGREVATLVDEHRSAGLQSDILWKPSGIASGIYLCRLTAGTFAETRKMAYIR